MRKIVNFCDYFVICTSSSDRRIHATADHIVEGIEKLGLKPYPNHHTSNNWVIIDTGSVVVHIFDEQAREFYGLEHLWQDAPVVNWKK